MLKFTIVLCMVTTVNFLWAAYIRHTSQNNAWRAALYAAATTLFSGTITITYVKDHSMIVPAILGAFIGTFFCLKFKKR
jgi:uncharacterized membrane protein (UPF0136 family)